jgi:outer membrane protein OmpA-like peptidoglycan-associated protein
MRFVNRLLLCIIFVYAFVYYVPALDINTNGQKGVLRTLSAVPVTKGTLNLGSGFTFSQSSGYFNGPVENGIQMPVTDSLGRIVDQTRMETARQFTSNIFLALTPLQFLNISLSLPYYYDWSGIHGVDEGGLGDFRLSTRLSPPSAIKGFYQGYFISGTIPVGMQNNGIFPRNSYYSENENRDAQALSFYSANAATLTAELLLTLDIKEFREKVPLQVHFNIGGSATSSNKNQRNLLLYNVAVEYNPAYFFSLFAELSGETRFGNLSTDIDLAQDPILFSPGMRITTPSGLYLMLAADIALTSDRMSARINHHPSTGAAKNYYYSTGVVPSYGAQFVLGWKGFMIVQDDDKDGIKNNVDRCPKEPEDIDGFEDTDGCLDIDNDHDWIVDTLDKCPSLPEDKDGFKDDDGCPDADNDSDSIIDINDKCPNAAEDIDGFEDEDGCPDIDNDFDAIPDVKDSCPDVKEDVDAYNDADGCPDLDNDRDGIVDSLDQCPNIPETFNNLRDDDGCPDTVKRESTLPDKQILQGILFRNNGPELTFSSLQYIEPVIRQMKQFPELEIEVHGHTDTLGDYTKNMKLSQMRAEAVRQYLISKGVEAKRIRAVGFGPTMPVADNRTAIGRSKNKRIEIIRIK